MDPKTELNEEEISAVKRFRKRVEHLLPQMKNDYLRHELGLVRFLRARNLNLDKSEEMLTQHLAWRRENDIDGLLKRETPSEMEKDFPVTVCGIDKQGNLIILVKFGRWDLRKAVESGLRNEFVLYITRLFELALDIAKDFTTPDKYVTQGFIIVDFEGFEFRQIMSKDVIETLLQTLQVFEANYPEILKTAWIINAPKVFQLFWAIIKPIMTPRTLAKIQIHGSDRVKWKRLIMEHVEPDSMPSEYGGSITTCPNVKFSCATLDVLFPTYETFPSESMTTVAISPGQKHKVHMEVAAGTLLTWNFKTAEFDVGFFVDYEGCETVVPYCRVDSHNYVQKGRLECMEDGKYTFTFDNSFSAFRGKTLSYVIQASGCKDTTDNRVIDTHM